MQSTVSVRTQGRGQVIRGKHIILTMGRSGSSTLQDMLNQNPALLNFGEVLGDWNRIRRIQKALGLWRDNDAAYLDALLGNGALQRAANVVRTIGKFRNGKRDEIKRLSGVRSIGFKEFSLNLERYGIPDYVTNAHDVKVIGLTRDNVLDRMISNEFLRATGVIASNSKGADKKHKLHIAPEDVIPKLDVISAENRVLQDMLEGLPADRMFSLDYEDLYSNEAHTIATMRKVYAFLDAPDIEPRVRMRKIAKRDPLDGIENGAEVREIIAGSPYAEFLVTPS